MLVMSGRRTAAAAGAQGWHGSVTRCIDINISK
jgi:hypothetical protein